MSFRFQGEKCHLTYKTHVPMLKIEEMMKAKRETKMFSIVHEVGDKDEDTPTPYAHTHVFWWWRKIYDTVDNRAFDIDEIHPNIQGNKGIQWAKGIVMRYHKGHKTKADGKKYFIAPVLLKQFGVDDWHFEADTWAIIQAAPDLKTACMAVDILPKSVGDVATVMREGKKRKFTELDDEADANRCKKVDWDRKKALVIRGNGSTGKTNWALAQFERPCMIEDIDQLKGIPHDCDGLVFDEMLFDFCAKKTQVYLTDLKFDRVIRCRNSNATIRKGMARIFTCNEHEHVFGPDPHFSVTRRYTSIDVEKDYDGKMYV